MNLPLTPRAFFPVLYLSVFAGLIAVFPADLCAKTTIDFSSVYPIDLPDSSSWERNFETVVDDNGPAYSNAFAFASTLGYTIGKASIGTFPSFEVGVSMSAGLTNMKNFQHTNTGIYKGTVPGLGLSPCIHFGMGLASGIDFIGKFMSYSQDVYKIPVPPNRYIKLDEFSQYALGGKIRYNYVTGKTVIPFLLNFGGITFSAGGDFMRGKFGVSGSYSYDLDGQTVRFTDAALPAPGYVDVPVTPAFDGKYNSDISWYQLSTTVQAIAYFDVMYVFSVFTGFSGTLGYGWYTFSFNATGDLEDKSGTLGTYNGGINSIGTATFKSSNKYNPSVFIPTYILGIELNIGFLKIVGESQVNLSNREDVSASLGVRAQF
jgi:hypothetical protein